MNVVGKSLIVLSVCLFMEFLRSLEVLRKFRANENHFLKHI